MSLYRHDLTDKRLKTLIKVIDVILQDASSQDWEPEDGTYSRQGINLPWDLYKEFEDVKKGLE